MSREKEREREREDITHSKGHDAIFSELVKNITSIINKK